MSDVRQMCVPCPDTDVKEIKHVAYVPNFILLFCRIYFLYNVKPEREPIRVGPRIKHDHFAFLIPTCWCPKRSRGPNANPNQPNTSPNASRWNIIRLAFVQFLVEYGPIWASAFTDHCAGGGRY